MAGTWCCAAAFGHGRSAQRPSAQHGWHRVSQNWKTISSSTTEGLLPVVETRVFCRRRPDIARTATSNRCQWTGIVSNRLRRFAVGPNERAAHALPVSKTRFPSNAVDRKPALFEQQLRRFESQCLESLGRRGAGLGSKHACELPRAEASDARKILDFERYSKVPFRVG